ncbi:hypothetical protein YM304_39730 [Ilumatobacter coccineus YM16-304]|uniref:Uncharacterized protein n=1 Tax=Ilumatobacter coccineus (strain NBRC 103263 / KCTC 29153 / YM16-304) TaxID=1313172 RepID=A0A6C7EC07_ILUCY|nr:hypothetical protein YM304_39730 [Ilumatobacter coccineus YM16-304]
MSSCQESKVQADDLGTSLHQQRGFGRSRTRCRRSSIDDPASTAGIDGQRLVGSTPRRSMPR